jgi:serine protease AprX
MKPFSILFTLHCIIFSIEAQTSQKYLVYFTDKGKYEKLTLEKRQYLMENYLSERALMRRHQRSIPTFDRVANIQDLPLDDNYLRYLEQEGFQIHGQLRWFNAVSGYAVETVIEQIRQFPFVERVEPVVKWRFVKRPTDSTSYQLLFKTLRRSYSDLDYGLSAVQIQFHNIDRLHAENLTGEGVIIGVFDTGFRLVNPSLQHVRSQLIAEYDFVQGDSVTSNQEGDRADQDSHGTLVLSILGGYAPGQLIGPAFGASYILAKTEIVDQEIHLEEDNWALAAEWAERLGVDIVSSSLGYSIFDEGEFNYSYQDMDGKTTLVTRAANELAKRGVLVVNSAGNQNPAWHWYKITAPADGMYVLAVGALEISNEVASFSSRGPSADGRIKPDVSALGVRVYGATVGQNYWYQQGTSVSCPLVAGLTAQLLQGNPHLNLLNLLDILRLSGDNTVHPDNDRGWGKVDAWKALNIASGKPYQPPRSNTVLPVRPNPYFRGNGIIFFPVNLTEIMPVTIKIYNTLGQKVTELFYHGMATQNLIPWDGRNSAGIPVPAGVYIYWISTPKWTINGKLVVLN